MTHAILRSIQVGLIAPLGPDGEPSGFVKHPADGPVRVGALGVEGDEQADLRVHGGAEKAVYGYAASHYPRWIADYPQHAALLVPGGMGENLTIDGWVEADLCVGDVHVIGEVRLQVCQPRQPCHKFALRFDDPGLPRAMVRNGRAGWYYRVLQEGTIRAGDHVALDDRPNAGFRFDRLVEIVNRGGASRAELEALAVMPGVASRIARKARAALD